jgi:hypothetical protein
MAIEKIREINRVWEKLMLEDAADGLLNKTFWHYEPFSDDYWKQQYKVVLCNLEFYGDVGKETYEERIFTLNQFKTWLGDGVRTMKNSALFIYSLYNKLHGIDVTEEQLRNVFHKNDDLLSVVKNITYMNLRKEEGWNTPEDRENIYRFLVPGYSLDPDSDVSNEEYRKFTLDFIDALEPDIFIVSGKTGCDVLNKIYEGGIDLAWQGMYRKGKTLYASVNHLSRVGYDYILKQTSEIRKKARE